ncbi:hypothetical protein Y1Q_0004478 [Alligator mississippiensis]|uniref:Sema domain-containing protein n=1 Tax=Alligator mississippiensis TaxID=8496 RepID=A0A151NY31_ALLMI|nr:hypothetical protein Y1Q_0004478 [Alligator mississippiensis]
MKEHFLMDRKVEPVGQHLLLEKQDVTYTCLAVHQVPGTSGAQGHKKPPDLPDQGFSHGVLQMPVANCSPYQSCANCVRARNPY